MAATPFAYRALLGVDGTRAASCDAGPIFTKEYSIELKLLLAFEMTSLAWTTVESFASNYSDVLLHILQDAKRGDDERRYVDLVLPFLELSKPNPTSNLPESALRKSKRGMPFYTCTFYVARTTIKGNFLGVAASCLVLVGIECHEQNRRRVCGVTVKCVATLVFSSIAAGIGAALFGPTTGQSKGFSLGGYVVPYIVRYCFTS